jgi:hypothetical protein
MHSAEKSSGLIFAIVTLSLAGCASEPEPQICHMTYGAYVREGGFFLNDGGRVWFAGHQVGVPSGYGIHCQMRDPFVLDCRNDTLDRSTYPTPPTVEYSRVQTPVFLVAIRFREPLALYPMNAVLRVGVDFTTEELSVFRPSEYPGPKGPALRMYGHGGGDLTITIRRLASSYPARPQGIVTVPAMNFNGTLCTGRLVLSTRNARVLDRYGEGS